MLMAVPSQCAEESMTFIRRVALVAIGVVAPILVAHALSSMAPQHSSGIGIPLVALLEMFGFAFLVATIRPRPLTAILAALLYFPCVFIVIFQIGYSAGYYDFP